jgi:hypothetical protein
LNRNPYTPVSGFASDQPVKDPPRWVLIVAIAIAVVGLLAFPLYRDEHAPSKPAVAPAKGAEGGAP